VTTSCTHRAFVGLGSNLDDPRRHIEQACGELAQLPATTLMRHSRLYRSEPVGFRSQPDFVNACAELATALEARPLLEAMQPIERAHRRVRIRPNGPRTLDLDLLVFDGCEIAQPGLVVPHPRLHERAFVLVPLVEIAPELVVPGKGPVADLLQRIDRDRVAVLDGASY
jgi:2-amino-4-hydroxy-6-hydroxymethyldihydropteridine diphosphokinase